jgi:hypothetical protein
MLTGPPRINGVLLPYPHYEGEGKGRMTWEPDHLYFKGRQGLVIRQRRYYGHYSFGYNVLPPEAFRKVAAALDLEDPARVVPATRAQGDPDDVSEEEYLCKTTSRVPAYGPGDVPGGSHSISASFRTVEWRPTRDGISESALAYGFDFSEDTDLLGGVQGTGESPTTWRAALPYAGRLVRLEAAEAGDVTVRFYADLGAQVGTDHRATLAVGESLYVDVPARTRQLEAEASGARPRVFLDADTFALTLTRGADGTHTLTAFGRGLFKQTGQIDVEEGGTVYTLGRTYDLTPRALGDQRISRPDDETLRVTHDT